MSAELNDVRVSKNLFCHDLGFILHSLYIVIARVTSHQPSCLFDFVCNFRQLLNMRSSPYLESLTERQLASLLYRDHVGLKHSRRDRLVKELSDCKSKEENQIEAKNHGMIMDMSKDHANDDPLLKALLDHIWEAH